MLKADGNISMLNRIEVRGTDGRFGGLDSDEDFCLVPDFGGSCFSVDFALVSVVGLSKLLPLFDDRLLTLLRVCFLALEEVSNSMASAQF